MMEVGNKIEYGGAMLEVVAFFDQPTVVLENEKGERVTVALTSLIYNRMQKTGEAQ